MPRQYTTSNFQNSNVTTHSSIVASPILTLYKYSPVFRQRTIVAHLSPSLVICLGLGVSVATFATIVTIHGDATQESADQIIQVELDNTALTRVPLDNYPVPHEKPPWQSWQAVQAAQGMAFSQNPYHGQSSCPHSQVCLPVSELVGNLTWALFQDSVVSFVFLY